MMPDGDGPYSNTALKEVEPGLEVMEDNGYRQVWESDCAEISIYVGMIRCGWILEISKVEQIEFVEGVMDGVKLFGLRI